MDILRKLSMKHTDRECDVTNTVVREECSEARFSWSNRATRRAMTENPGNKLSAFT
jgi:hypothetical protein